MNKRIKELAEQFNLEIDPAHPDHNQKVLEKFAELLIRECIEIVDSGYLIGPGNQLREHFGVEDQYEPEYCPTCDEEWSGTSCGANCGWVTGVEE